MTLGRLCRIPLPEFSTTIEERIIELNYRDKKNRPEEVRITMGNQRDDLTHIIADEIKQGGGQSGSGRGGGGRGSVRQAKDDHAWFEDTNEHVAMCAEGIVGVDAYGKPNWVRLSQLIVDGAGIHGNVTSLIDGALYQQSKVEMNESQIGLVVGRYNDQNYIKAAEIVVAINDADEGVVHISADHVYMGTVGNERPIDVEINGKLTAQDITANLINAAFVNGGTFTAAGISCGGNINATGAVIGGGVYWGSAAPYNSADDAIKAVQIDGPTNGVYTLQYKRFSDSTWQNASVTFSRATSLSGAWSGSTYTVTASPQENTISETIYMYADGNSSSNFTVGASHGSSAVGNSVASAYIYLTEDTANKKVQAHLGSSTGTVYGEISTAATYNAGAAGVTLSEGSWSSGVKTVSASNGASVNVSIPANSSSEIYEDSLNTWKAKIVLGDTTRYADAKTIYSHHSIAFGQSALTSGGNLTAKFRVESACQYKDGNDNWNDNPETYTGGNARSTRDYELFLDGSYVKVRRVGGSDVYARLSTGYHQVTDGTGAYRFVAYYQSSSGRYYALGGGEIHQWFYL